jgi:hypothetical protein
MPPDKSPLEGSLIVAALIVLAIVFAGHWIVSYVQNGNPWAITPAWRKIPSLRHGIQDTRLE